MYIPIYKYELLKFMYRSSNNAITSKKQKIQI